MRLLESYLSFCKRFERIKFPNLKLKIIPEHYLNYIKEKLNIQPKAINKATFFIFSFSFTLSLLIMNLFTSFNLLFLISTPFFISISVSYVFFKIPYKSIQKSEKIINSNLYLLKLNFSLVQESTSDSIDMVFKFIELMIKQDSTISHSFNLIMNGVLNGHNPDLLLSRLNTPSKDFNDYLKLLNLTNYRFIPEREKLNEISTEDNFKVYLKEIESKISVFFFIGLFFPIGLCIFTIFYKIDLFYFILTMPLFLIIMRFLFKKFIVFDNFLLGILDDSNSEEHALFDDFLIYLKSFSLYLENNHSPEYALLLAYEKEKKNIVKLSKIIKPHISELIQLKHTIGDYFKKISFHFNSKSYSLILMTIKEMLEKDAYETSMKIDDIIDIIFRHRKLEKKMNILLKSKKFSVIIFIFLLPLITGGICGMFPYFLLIDLSSFSSESLFLIKELDFFIIIVLFVILLVNNSISCYYFSKIVRITQKSIIIILSNLLLLISYMSSFILSLILI